MNELYQIIHDQAIAIEALNVQNEILKNERNIAVDMLAGWCLAIDTGADWDNWDDHYKDARYRDGPIRYLIDAAMEKHRVIFGN